MIEEPQLINVLAALHRRRDFRENGFSSHDVIQEYCRRYEIEYLDWLMMYHGTGRAFQMVHKQIGRFLSKYEHRSLPRRLAYHRIDRADSECVHGTIDCPMWWEFIV